MDDNTRFMLFGLGLPGAMGLLVGWAGAHGARQPVPEAGAPRTVMSLIVVVVLAVLAGAIALSTYGVHGGISIRPISSDDRLRYVPGVLFLFAVTGVITCHAIGTRTVGGVGTHAVPLDRAAAVVCSILAAAICVGIALGETSVRMPKVIALPVMAIWAGLTCKFLIRFHERNLRVRAGVLLVGLGAAVGAALAGTGSFELGKYGFGVGAIVAAVTLGALIARGPTRPFTLSILCAFMATLLGCGVYLSATPWWVVIALGAVVPVAYLADFLASKRLTPKAAGAIAIAVGAAIALAAIAPGIKSLIDFIAGPRTPQY